MAESESARSQDEQLRALFADFASEPPPTSMSSLQITAMALSQSRGRVRRQRRVLGVAAAAVVLGLGTVLLSGIGGSVEETTTASATKNAPAPLMETAAAAGASSVAPESSDARSDAALAAPAEAYGAESAISGDVASEESGAESAGEAGGVTAAEDATGEEGADGAGSAALQTSAASAATSAAASAPEFVSHDWAVGVAMEPVGGLPNGSTACVLPALPEAGLQQVAQRLSLSDSPPVRLTAECDAGGAGSAVRVGDAMVLIYLLDDVDPCLTQCYPGPAADVRYSSAMSGTAVVISAVDGRYLVLEPLLRDAFDPVTLTEIGRAVLAATSE